jgi:hypothetical protein
MHSHPSPVILQPLSSTSISYPTSSAQGLKSIGNTGTVFPGRQPVGRKEEAFIIRNQDSWSFIPKKVNKLENSSFMVLFAH